MNDSPSVADIEKELGNKDKYIKMMEKKLQAYDKLVAELKDNQQNLPPELNMTIDNLAEIQHDEQDDMLDFED